VDHWAEQWGCEELSWRGTIGCMGDCLRALVEDTVRPFLPGSFMVVYRDIFDVEFAVALALPASNPL
jgi:hypothetical protein